jgi:hypothetical protein
VQVPGRLIQGTRELLLILVHHHKFTNLHVLSVLPVLPSY